METGRAEVLAKEGLRLGGGDVVVGDVAADELALVVQRVHTLTLEADAGDALVAAEDVSAAAVHQQRQVADQGLRERMRRDGQVAIDSRAPIWLPSLPGSSDSIRMVTPP